MSDAYLALSKVQYAVGMVLCALFVIAALVAAEIIIRRRK